MAFMTIDAHNLVDEFVESILKDYQVTIKDRSGEPWVVVFEGTRENLVAMHTEHWACGDPEMALEPESIYLSDEYHPPKQLLDVLAPVVGADTEAVDQAAPAAGNASVAHDSLLKFVTQLSRMSIWSHAKPDGTAYQECAEPSDGFLDSHCALMGLIEESRTLLAQSGSL
jgi:hypothetical protein